MPDQHGDTTWKDDTERGECYWCGGEPADGGTIKVQMRDGEPKRETCPDCFRDWPPDEVEECYTDTGTEHSEGSE